jgi:hypothetical protein
MQIDKKDNLQTYVSHLGLDSGTVKTIRHPELDSG